MHFLVALLIKQQGGCLVVFWVGLTGHVVFSTAVWMEEGEQAHRPRRELLAQRVIGFRCVVPPPLVARVTFYYPKAGLRVKVKGSPTLGTGTVPFSPPAFVESHKRGENQNENDHCENYQELQHWFSPQW